MKSITKDKRILSVIFAIVMLFGLAGPFAVLADAPVTIDSAIMPQGSNGAGYTGSADAAFEIVDGNTLKISFKALAMDQETMQMPNSVESVTNGFVNNTFTGWIARYSPTILFNDEELGTDTSADKYAVFSREMVTEGKKIYDVDTIEVKPGVEITSNFFETNKVTLAVYSQNVYVEVGKYDNGGAEPQIRPARVITPNSEEYVIGRSPKEAGGTSTSNPPRWQCKSDADSKWPYAITNITYSVDGSAPTELGFNTGGWNSTVTSQPNKNAKVIVSGKNINIQTSLFTGLNLAPGTKKDVSFTIKATGYEDSTFIMSIKNPASGFSVWNGDTVAKTFTNDDLTALWESEGSKSYKYSTYSTFPTYETSTRYGPTLNAVFNASGIDLASLSDKKVIKFVATDGFVVRFTAKELKQTRYCYPNGESKNDFKGTTSDQYEGKTEVPYIIDMSEMNSGKGLRNAFGQIDPQDQTLFDFIQNLESIEILDKEAATYEGLTPSLADKTAVKEGDQLSFSFSIDNWQGSQNRYAAIYYTVSTDGTEPADPTLASTMYNYAQYQNVNQGTDKYNRYTFTNDAKTIIKVMTYIRGYAEPKVMTLTYTHDHAATAAVIENEKAATCTEPGSYEEVVYCSECGAEISRETKPVEALGHTEVAIGEAKAATCTEAGMTAGKKCSVCGETLEAQKELPALGHDWKVIPEVISTCTKKGSTAGVRCTRCGEYMLEPHEVPMIYHDYQNGKCTVCGAEDPDYKPDEPTPVEPDTKFTGLANEADKDGAWWYYTDGKIDKTHTGVDQNKYGWWRVENGKVNFNAQSIYQNQYGWWKTTDGEVTFKENSIYQNEYGWWKCKDSKVDFNAQSIYQNKYGWWKTTNGKVSFKEQGIYQNNYGWWKCKDSKVDFNANGKVTYNGKTYNVKNGKATLS